MNESPSNHRPEQHPNAVSKKLIGFGILLLIAAIHAFRIGSYLDGRAYQLYYSYASDLMLPFGIYFLLCLQEKKFPFLKPWPVKAGLIFSACTITEILQAFNIHILGTTFDPLDIMMFGIGVLAAAAVEQFLLTRLVKGWKEN